MNGMRGKTVDGLVVEVTYLSMRNTADVTGLNYKRHKNALTPRCVTNFECSGMVKWHLSMRKITRFLCAVRMWPKYCSRSYFL
jgi:hypothetical protein